ncbi:MAG: MFS transporter [Candidatus Thorarchaeota archaeon]|jgi:MFS family permease
MNDQQVTSDEETTDVTTSTKKVLLLGVLTLFAITAAAILHVNQPEFILDRFVGISEFEYSLFDTTLYLSYLIFGIITGLLSDRWAKRQIFALVGASGSIVFYWLMTTTLSFPLLLLYRFIQGSFTVMVWQTFMTLAIDFSDSSNRGRNMGIFGAFLAIGMGLGPAIGGVIASIGVFVPYYTAAGLNVVVLVIGLVGLKDPTITKARPTLKQSVLLARKSPELIVPGIFNLFDRLHIGFILTALPYFLSVILGLDESLRGMSLAIITSPPAMALVGDIVGQEDSAMGMGFFNFLGNLGITMGPIIFGILFPIMGMTNAFIVVGVLELITLALNVALVKIVFKDKIR